MKLELGKNMIVATELLAGATPPGAIPFCPELEPEPSHKNSNGFAPLIYSGRDQKVFFLSQARSRPNTTETFNARGVPDSIFKYRPKSMLFVNAFSYVIASPWRARHNPGNLNSGTPSVRSARIWA